MLGMLLPPFEFRMDMNTLQMNYVNPATLPKDAATSFFLPFDKNDYHLGQQPEPHSFDPNSPHLRTVKKGADKNNNNVNNFVWLPFIPGFITYVPFDRELPILTGKMSGCWLALFMMNGKPFLCHIGTHDANENLTNRVKKSWQTAVSSKKISPYRAIKPYGQEYVAMFAGLSAKGTFYSLGCSAPQAGDYKIDKRSEIGASPSAPLFT